MKMISKRGLIGMSLLIWIGGIVSGGFGQNNGGDFMFMQKTNGSELLDELCKMSEDWNWEEQCKNYTGTAAADIPPDTKEEIKECAVKCGMGGVKLCCNGGSWVCDDCQTAADYKFCGDLRKQISDGVTPEYCNNFQKPGVCGKGPTSDKNACKNSKNTSPHHKSSFLLMIAAITITIMFTLPPMFC